jgi:PIN domain nuclease of toxin-antitoxin system
VNLLLDTHILLWWATDDPKLDPITRKTLADPSNRIYFSSISIWEVSIKHAKGLLEVSPTTLRESSIGAGLLELNFNGRHAVKVSELPPIHSDPFDRGLIAQALVESFTLVSVDRQVQAYF